MKLLPVALVLRCVLTALVAALAAVPVRAATDESRPPLEERATPELLAEFFPAADRFTPADGNPPASRAFRGDELFGYVVSTFDVLRPPSFSPDPFDALVGIDMGGTVTGVRLLSFHDSYLVGMPANTALVETYLARLVGFAALSGLPFPEDPDFAAGVTISARSMASGILNAARAVVLANSGPPVAEPALDRLGVDFRSWDELVAEDALVERRVTFGELRDRFAAAGADPAAVALAVPVGADTAMLSALRFGCRFDAFRTCAERAAEIHADDETYIDFAVALGTPPRIGRNFVAADRYDRFFATHAEGTQMLLLFSSGHYSFLGTAYDETARRYLFDRFRLVQGDIEIAFDRDQQTTLSVGGGGMPFVGFASAFAIPPGLGFDPLQPFDIVLLVHGQDQGRPLTIDFPVRYQVPADAVLLPFVEPPPEWVLAWRQSVPEVTVLGVALLVLTGIFALQRRLARSRRVHGWVRTGFLLFTLGWLGWTAGGQLSIQHVVNYLKAPFAGIDIGFYLREPLIVMISAYVVVSMILIGRGVFCGWLCPFGALQELTAKVGKFLRLPTWTPRGKWQRWLWLPKYGTAALIVGIAFAAPASQAVAEEIEPFNTAIGSMFSRPAPYVAYAVVLIVMSLFTERFFCRFLCPLGGFLAVADRLHIFTFLKRRAECGSGGCHLCERSCPVRAIEPSGRIAMAECFQCLDCQVEYHDDLAARRWRGSGRTAIRS